MIQRGKLILCVLTKSIDIEAEGWREARLLAKKYPRAISSPRSIEIVIEAVSWINKCHFSFGAVAQRVPPCTYILLMLSNNM